MRHLVVEFRSRDEFLGGTNSSVDAVGASDGLTVVFDAPTGPPKGGAADEPPHKKVRSLSRPVAAKRCDFARDNGQELWRFPVGFRVWEREAGAVSRVFFSVSGSPVFAPILGRVLRLLPKKGGGLGGTGWACRSCRLRTDAGRLVRERVTGRRDRAYTVFGRRCPLRR